MSNKNNKKAIIAVAILLVLVLGAIIAWYALRPAPPERHPAAAVTEQPAVAAEETAEPAQTQEAQTEPADAPAEGETAEPAEAEADEVTITVSVTHADGSEKEFVITTEALNLRGALEQENLVQGDESEYGLFVTTVDGEGLSLVATAPSGSRLWCIGDTLRECRLLSDDGENATFEVLYPLGVPYELFMSTPDGAWHAQMPAKGKRVHAWNWEGGSFVLELRKGEVLETDYSIKADYESYLLNTRPRETVYAGRTFKGSFTAVGSDVPGRTDSSRESAIALQEAVHAVYRSPSGWVRDVAVTGIDMTVQRGITDYSVSMVEEAV